MSIDQAVCVQGGGLRWLPFGPERTPKLLSGRGSGSNRSKARSLDDKMSPIASELANKFIQVVLQRKIPRIRV